MKQGDFILMDFVGKITSTGEVFDLTSADEAKKAGIFSEKQKYEPVLVIIGAGMVILGVDEQLLKMNPDDEREFDVKSEKAFGFRNLKLIKIMSMANFLREKINPVPGLFVTINNQQAKIQSVSGGRVRVDFNHPLAGKELHYWVKITKVIKETEEKVKSIFDYYNIKTETSIKEGILTVKTEKKLDPIVEKLVSETIKRWIKDIKNVKFEYKETKNNQKTSEIKQK